MPYDPYKHHRRSIRLKGYDYSSAGAYFVTICVKGGESVLGEVVDGEMVLNEYGRIVQACWQDLVNHYKRVILDAFVIMPNHIHFIVVFVEGGHVGAGLRPAPTNNRKRHGLPEIVRALKSFSSRRINELRDTIGTPFWQRNYYERIIRNERALNAIREYIQNNPANWLEDQLHPAASPNPFNRK
ncbi:transposase [Candidatus Leptofilum sp.]|uniref:transposase n=1 Tax=Candidatus Leptofilum sp. TaxID=3241576 RepID=UPI003B5C0154